MDKPAPDRDASVKSLGIFLNNKGHLESQILSELLREKGSNFLNNQGYVKRTHNSENSKTRNALNPKKNVCVYETEITED